MFIHRIKLKNILSFGPDAQDLELGPLNVLIGPNGSGKSNLIEVIGLLKAAPSEISKPVREGGGVDDWLWRGQPRAETAELEAIVEYPGGRRQLRYGLAFGASSGHFTMVGERLEDERPSLDGEKPWVCFEADQRKATINRRNSGDGQSDSYMEMSSDQHQSVLSQLKDPKHLPEMTYLGTQFKRIQLHREWSFGRHSAVRVPQKTDLPNASLMEDCQNLGLVLNRLTREIPVKQRFLKALGELYEGLSDFHVDIEYGTVQLFLHEGDVPLSAMRLSDGTLRYVCLLAILLDPSPPPLICVEEPELGLHPDILPRLAELLREASERCQLVVTTHSDVIVDSLTDTPESVVVCEKEQRQTVLKRLDRSDLAHWLDKYRLGELWSSGELGGNRW